MPKQRSLREFKPLFDKRVKRPVKRYLRRRDRSAEKRFLWRVIKTLLLVAAPFIALIRGAVYLHQHHHWSAWPAVFGGMVATTGLLWIYWMWIRRRLTFLDRKQNYLKNSFLIILLIVFLYSLYGLLYFSADNAKDERVQNQFHRLHPILRLGVSTLILIDADLLITDTTRRPEDYRRMGLKTARHSLHYVQSSGYSHAVDIRTNGRGWIRNRLIQAYFVVLGFNTLRHVGTADHLHISLSSHDRLGAI